MEALVGQGSVKKCLVPACDVWVSLKCNTARVS